MSVLAYWSRCSLIWRGCVQIVNKRKVLTDCKAGLMIVCRAKLGTGVLPSGAVCAIVHITKFTPYFVFLSVWRNNNKKHQALEQYNFFPMENMGHSFFVSLHNIGIFWQGFAQNYCYSTAHILSNSSLGGRVRVRVNHFSLYFAIEIGDVNCMDPKSVYKIQYQFNSHTLVLCKFTQLL